MHRSKKSVSHKYWIRSPVQQCKNAILHKGMLHSSAWTRDNAVGTPTRLWARRRKDRGSIQGKDMKFLYSPYSPSRLWGSQPSRMIGNEDTSSEETNVELKPNHSLLSTARFKNVCSSAHSSPYATMAFTGTVFWQHVRWMGLRIKNTLNCLKLGLLGYYSTYFRKEISVLRGT